MIIKNRIMLGGMVGIAGLLAGLSGLFVPARAASPTALVTVTDANSYTMSAKVTVTGNSEPVTVSACDEVDYGCTNSVSFAAGGGTKELYLEQTSDAWMASNGEYGPIVWETVAFPLAVKFKTPNTISVPRQDGVIRWLKVGSKAPVVLPAGDTTVPCGRRLVVSAEAAPGYYLPWGMTQQHRFSC